MSMNAAEVERAMLALDRRELASVIHRGIQVLDSGDTDAPQEVIEAAWHDELTERINDIENGNVDLIPLEESFARTVCHRGKVSVNSHTMCFTT